jgi:hypothetical protein
VIKKSKYHLGTADGTARRKELTLARATQAKAKIALEACKSSAKEATSIRMADEKYDSWRAHRLDARRVASRDCKSDAPSNWTPPAGQSAINRPEPDPGYLGDDVPLNASLLGVQVQVRKVFSPDTIENELKAIRGKFPDISFEDHARNHRAVVSTGEDLVLAAAQGKVDDAAARVSTLEAQYLLDTEFALVFGPTTSKVKLAKGLVKKPEGFDAAKQLLDTIKARVKHSNAERNSKRKRFANQPAAATAAAAPAPWAEAAAPAPRADQLATTPRAPAPKRRRRRRKGDDDDDDDDEDDLVADPDLT